MKQVTLTRNDKIANVQFVLSIMIVLIHAMTVFVNLPDNETQYVFGVNYSAYIQLFLGEGICRVAVPLFFVISGYLYYKNFDGSWEGYRIKLKRRISSLVIPYLFWSGAVFFIFFFAQKIPWLSAYFTTRNADALSIKVILDNVILHSYNSPLWYMRYLIIFALLSLVWYWIAKKFPVMLLLVSFYGWFFGFRYISVPFRMDAVFFYSVGVVIAIHKNSVFHIENKISNWFKYISMVLWIFLLVFRTAYYCQLKPEVMLQGQYDALLSYSGKIGILLGIAAVWYGFDMVFSVRTKMWDVSKYSMLIFVSHHPIVNTFKKIILKLLGSTSELTTLITYILATLLTIFLILLVGKFVKKHLPQLWKYSLGGR